MLIQNEFLSGYVLAEVELAGTCWAIARPLGRGQPSWAVPGAGWEDLRGDHTSFHDYDQFQQAVEQVALAEFPRVVLPHEGRPPTWTDLLGWLARDKRSVRRQADLPLAQPPT